MNNLTEVNVEIPANLSAFSAHRAIGIMIVEKKETQHQNQPFF
jgi:hypothetical protein